MCHFQTLLKTDQRRFDALRVLQVMIRARCFASPFNLAIKKRYIRRDLIEKLQQLDLTAVMSQEIRAAYMTIHNIELNFEQELLFEKDIDRAVNAYLIKRFDLWPRVQDTMDRIQKLVIQGKPFMPTEWENFLTSTKGTAALMAAKVKLLQEIYDSLRLGRGYEVLQDKSPELWETDRVKYLHVRELVETQNPNAFDDFIYDKLKTGRAQSIFTTARTVTFDPKVSENVIENSEQPERDLQPTNETLLEDYPDWRKLTTENSTSPPLLYLKPGEEYQNNTPRSEEDLEKIIDKVEKEIGDVVQAVLTMKEDELPEKFQRIIKRARENIKNSKSS